MTGGSGGWGWRSLSNHGGHQVQQTEQRLQTAALVHRAWWDVQRADANAQQVYGRRQQQAAGVFGENKLAWALSILPDDGVTLRGYRHKRCETDHVLVGPHGLWAVEVKYRRVRLNVDGDSW